MLESPLPESAWLKLKLRSTPRTPPFQRVVWLIVILENFIIDSLSLPSCIGYFSGPNPFLFLVTHHRGKSSPCQKKEEAVALIRSWRGNYAQSRS
jgi:hypothetical protein